MNPREIDETLLTAYALGELDARERARVAAHVEADAEARRHVDDVRDAAAMVTSELTREPVEGLLAIQREMIERRLRDGANSRQSGRGLRLRRWLPLAASVAASVAIVGGIAAVLLPKFRQTPVATDQGVVDSSSGTGVKVIGPEETIQSPTLPDGPGNLAQGELSEMPGESLDDVAHGGDADEGPVEGMIDPREYLADRRGSDLSERPAAPAPPAPAGTAVKPAPPVSVEPKLADGRGPAHSPEAEDIGAREKKKATPPPVGKGKRAPKVYVSPPRDPKAFEQIKNRAAAPDLTRIFENPFRTAAARPRSAFPVRVERWSYVTVRTSLLEKQMPPPVRVRIEELVNRFAYDYPSPPEDGPPLAATVEVATCPWNVDHRLARVAIKAREGGATVVAKAVEASVEFNPQATAQWRLIGYENSPAASQPKTFPFDLAAGGTATAFYEIMPAPGAEARNSSPKDLFTVKVKYSDPGNDAPQSLTCAATDAGAGFDRASEDFRFATSVAAFGLLLRDSQFKGTATYADVIRWATAGKGADATKEREALIDLVKVARDLAK